jgi:hypothetical protein
MVPVKLLRLNYIRDIKTENVNIMYIYIYAAHVCVIWLSDDGYNT